MPKRALHASEGEHSFACIVQPSINYQPMADVMPHPANSGKGLPHLGNIGMADATLGLGPGSSCPRYPNSK